MEQTQTIIDTAKDSSNSSKGKMIISLAKGWHRGVIRRDYNFLFFK